MPIHLMRRCFRERRRFALVVVLVFLAQHLAGLDANTLPLATGWVAVGAGLVAALAAALAPALRGYAEAMALAGLGFAGLARVLPGSSVDLASPAGDGLAAAAVLVSFVVLASGARHALAALPWPDLRNPRFRARAGTRADIFRLWYGLVPTPGMTARYGDPDVIAIDGAGPQPSRIRLVTHRAPDRPRETLLQVLEVEAPFHIRFAVSECDPCGTQTPAGTSEIFLVELGPRRLVLFTHDFPRLSLGRALLAWLDDAPGRLLDRRLATIERRALAPGAHPGAVATGHPLGAPAAAVEDGAVRAPADRPAPSPLGAPTGPG